MTEDRRSIQELFSTAFAQMGRLLRSELQLAKAEVSTSITNAGVGAGLLGGALAVGIAALVLLLLAISAWLADALGVSPGTAHLLTAVLGAIVAGALAWSGLSRLKSDSLGLPRTVEQIEQDAAAVKERMK
jgi:hypothetical protein